MAEEEEERKDHEISIINHQSGADQSLDFADPNTTVIQAD